MDRAAYKTSVSLRRKRKAVGRGFESHRAHILMKGEIMYNVVDLFAGCGGFSRGFREAGFNIALAIENMPIVAKSFKENFPESIVLVKDIKLVKSEEIESYVKKVDVVIGGPPCEPFTGTNPRRLKDPLDRLYADPIGMLVLEFIRLVGDLQPRVFVMENVPGILEGYLKLALRKEFERIGYKDIHFNVLRAEDYGVPSHRTRVFISNVRIKPPKADHRITVIEAIGDLPEPDEPHNIPNHDPIYLPPKKIKRIAKLKWGEGLIKYLGAGGKVYTNYIRLHPYKLAPTVMGSSRFIHPFYNRLLTARENARLMSFPDDHIFLGSRDQQFNQVGEAVPVLLAKSIAQEIIKYLAR